MRRRETQLYLVLLETASNQRTVFQTNRLRENIGASELIYRVGTRFVLRAIGADERLASDPAELQAFLLNEKSNPPIESRRGKGKKVEVILATSGKAMLLTRTPELAREIVSAVTWRTLTQAPGVTVRGAIVEFTWDEDQDAAQELHQTIKEAHEKLEALRSQLPSPDLRFARLPFVEECCSSGLPAYDISGDKKLRDPISRIVKTKRCAGRGAVRRRMEKVLPGIGFPKNISHFDGWMAIVHADGNGLGQVFLDFLNHAQACSPRDYIDKLRRFSLAIDLCSRKAAQNAIRQTWPDAKKKPVVPIVVGGDDLTVVCDGTRAVRFAAAYLRAFEGASQGKLQAPLGTIIRDIISGGNGGNASPDRLAGAAGIAIVKPHFPFHRAYDIAEALTASAKKVKLNVTTHGSNGKPHPYPCSALDFQVVLDSSGADLEPIRERMKLAGNTTLYARPYVVTIPEDAAPISSHGRNWLAVRLYGEESGGDQTPTLRRAVRALRRQPPEAGQTVGKGEGHLPRGQAHVLLEALDRGPDTADGALALIRQRYDQFDWSAFLSNRGNLFFEDKDEEGTTWQRTRFLDAMELADLEAQGIARVICDDTEDDNAPLEEEAA